MGRRAAKDRLFDGLAVAAKALGNGRRAEIVDLLTQGERHVEQIAAEIDQSVANTSQHLQHLLRAGLVHSRRNGLHIHYRLSSPRVAELWAALRDVAAEHVAELDQLAAAYLGDRTELDAVTRAELLDRLHQGDVMVLDVRPEPEYRAGHIAGAVSMPPDDLHRRLRDVPQDATVVAYCRGPYCVYADDAVRALQQRGTTAARLEEGFPEWARTGLPVETGAAPTTATPAAGQGTPAVPATRRPAGNGPRPRSRQYRAQG